jgi:hypothetical protein
MKRTDLKGKFQNKRATITVDLPVMIFEEKGTQIAYIPVLDISGYGETEPEAKESLEHCLSEYFSYTTNKNTLIEDLKAHGWTIKKKTKPYIAPEITDLFSKNEYLHNIVNSIPYKMDRMGVEMPQFV